MAHQEKVHTPIYIDSDHKPNKNLGGKAKPLKAPKKDKKEMDEDEIAYKAKQAAGEEP